MLSLPRPRRGDGLCLGLGWDLTEHQWVDRACRVASCTEGEAGTVKALISSCVPSPSSTGQVISPSPHRKPRMQVPEENRYSAEVPGEVFLWQLTKWPFSWPAPLECRDLRVAHSHRPQGSGGSLRA